MSRYNNSITCAKTGHRSRPRHRHRRRQRQRPHFRLGRVSRLGPWKRTARNSDPESQRRRRRQEQDRQVLDSRHRGNSEARPRFTDFGRHFGRRYFDRNWKNWPGIGENEVIYATSGPICLFDLPSYFIGAWCQQLHTKWQVGSTHYPLGISYHQLYI